MAKWAKGLVLSPQWLGLMLWWGLEPWPGNFHMLLAWPKKKKKKKKKWIGGGGSRKGEVGALAVAWVTCTKTDVCSALWPALFSRLLIPTCLIDTLAMVSLTMLE